MSDEFNYDASKVLTKCLEYAEKTLDEVSEKNPHLIFDLDSFNIDIGGLDEEGDSVSTNIIGYGGETMVTLDFDDHNLSDFALDYLENIGYEHDIDAQFIKTHKWDLDYGEYFNFNGFVAPNEFKELLLKEGYEEYEIMSDMDVYDDDTPPYFAWDNVETKDVNALIRYIKTLTEYTEVDGFVNGQELIPKYY